MQMAGFFLLNDKWYWLRGLINDLTLQRAQDSSASTSCEPSKKASNYKTFRCIAVP